MSRHGYTDEGDNIALWRGQVASAIRGKRGQAFLREMLDALEAMPEKKLIMNELQQPDGMVCALGSVGVRRGMDLSKLDPEDYYTLADNFGIAHQMICEIEFINDEGAGYWSHKETPEARWQRVHDWVERNLWEWTWE